MSAFSTASRRDTTDLFRIKVHGQWFTAEQIDGVWYATDPETGTPAGLDVLRVGTYEAAYNGWLFEVRVEWTGGGWQCSFIGNLPPHLNPYK